MRLLALVLTVLLMSPATALAQEFYRLYEQGVSAFKAGKFDEAKQKLQAAKAKSDKQGQRIFFYGLRYDEYVPDYYLGLIALQEKRYSEARRLLEGVETGKLLAARDREKNQALTDALGTLQQVARNEQRPPPPPPGGNTGSGTTTPSGNTGSNPPGGTSTPAPTWPADFQRALGLGEQALRDRKYADARSAAATARPFARDARTQADLTAFERRVRTEESNHLAEAARNALNNADDGEAQGYIDRLATANPQHAALDALRAALGDLRRRRDADQIAVRARQALSGGNAAQAAQEIGRLTAVNPGHAALPALRGELTKLEIAVKARLTVAEAGAELARRRQAVEREAVRFYLRGEYDQARAQVQAFAEGPSPRMRLYLACSQAALALLKGDKALADEARRTYGPVKGDTVSFATDFRYISPSVRQVLVGGGTL